MKRPSETLGLSLRPTLNLLTGEPSVPLLQLRIKELAAHAGHSRPLELSKAHTSLQQVSSSHFPSNNLWTAHGNTATFLAVVVSWIALLITPRLPQSLPKQTTPTLQCSTPLANTKTTVLCKFRVTMTSLQTTVKLFLTQLHSVPSQLQLRLTRPLSAPTPEVSLQAPLVASTSTTVCLP